MAMQPEAFPLPHGPRAFDACTAPEQKTPVAGNAKPPTGTRTGGAVVCATATARPQPTAGCILIFSVRSCARISEKKRAAADDALVNAPGVSLRRLEKIPPNSLPNCAEVLLTRSPASLAQPPTFALVARADLCARRWGNRDYKKRNHHAAQPSGDAVLARRNIGGHGQNMGGGRWGVQRGAGVRGRARRAHVPGCKWY